MNIEKLNCASCGAPIPITEIGKVEICEHCGSRQIVTKTPDGLVLERMELASSLATIEAQIEAKERELKNLSYKMNRLKQEVLRSRTDEYDSNHKKGPVVQTFLLGAFGMILIAVGGFSDRSGLVNFGGIVLVVGIISFFASVAHSDKIDKAREELREEILATKTSKLEGGEELIVQAKLVERDIKKLKATRRKIKQEMVSPSGEIEGGWDHTHAEGIDPHSNESTLHEIVRVGDIVSVKVYRITSFAAFVELPNGLEGQIHISQVADHRIDNVEEVLEVDDVMDAMITEIDQDKLRLSRRAVLEGWTYP